MPPLSAFEKANSRLDGQLGANRGRLVSSSGWLPDLHSDLRICEKIKKHLSR